MDRNKLIETVKNKIHNEGLINVAKETGISVGHLHHIIFNPEVYPLSKKMEQRLRRVVENKSEVEA